MKRKTGTLDTPSPSIAYPPPPNPLPTLSPRSPTPRQARLGHPPSPTATHTCELVRVLAPRRSATPTACFISDERKMSSARAARCAGEGEAGNDGRRRERETGPRSLGRGTPDGRARVKRGRAGGLSHGRDE